MRVLALRQELLMKGREVEALRKSIEKFEVGKAEMEAEKEKMSRVVDEGMQ